MVALYQNLMDAKKVLIWIEKIFSSFQTDIYLTCFYSVLARSGYFPVSELATFRLINSRLQGHPTTHDGLPELE
jgi:transketolase